MEAFANAADLAKVLNRTFEEGAETEWIDALLADASDLLRTIIGQQVYPQSTSTYTAYPDTDGREDLPQWPVVSVSAVERDGNPVPFRQRPGYIVIKGGTEPADVTFTYGYAECPPELRRLACVLVSQALIPLENQLGLTAGGLSSVAIDDFRLAWADAGSSSGMSMTKHAERSVRAAFGRGGVQVVETV